MVEWKTLNDLCSKITDGSHFSPQSVEDGFYMPSVKDMTTKGFDYSSCKKISEEDYRSLIKTGCKPKKNDVLVAKDGSMLKYVFPVTKEENIVVLSSIAILTPKIEVIDSRYLSFYLLRSDVKEQTIREFSSKGGVPRIILKNFKKIKIPVPSIQEQERVVGILDTFTSSIENLKQQIAQRRKQYEYYRGQLLDLEGKEGVEIKTLKDVFDTRNGYTPSTSNSQFWDDGIIPWFKMEDIRDNGRILNDSNLHITTSAIKGKGLFKANSIILATSATIGEHALITVEHLSNQRFTNFYPKECYLNIINMKFVYYYMYRIDEWCKQHINQGGFASVDMGGLYNLEIPLPSLQEQQRIVSILDTFEASIQNLEAQLSKREKQYEYYRNKLLTFE